MCGIIGYVGKKNILDVLINGLKKLEYRGYDSSGLAIYGQNVIFTHRAVGKVDNMVLSLPKRIKEIVETPLNEKIYIGLAHTRWATHGRPSEENAHPHTDCRKEFVLVHNGIIENYMQLKSELVNHKFLSQTDTEVVVHLIEEKYKTQKDVLKAFTETIKMLEGSFAIVLFAKHEPQKLFFARKDSPLIIGIGDDEKIVASDVLAMLDYTNKFIFLENGDYGYVTKDEVKIFNIYKEKEEIRTVQIVNWTAQMAQKAGFKHFMLKEIYEQPQVLRENIVSRVFGEEIVFDEEVNFRKKDLKKVKKILMIGCGTSYHAALVCKYFFESIVKIPVEVDIGSEFRYRDFVLEKDTLAIFISQSGETADTLASLRIIKQK